MCGDCWCVAYSDEIGAICMALIDPPGTHQEDGLHPELDKDDDGYPLRHADCPVQCREDRDALAKGLAFCLGLGGDIDDRTRFLASVIGVDPERLRELLEVK
jgi:hypothetical protein